MYGYLQLLISLALSHSLTVMRVQLFSFLLSPHPPLSFLPSFLPSVLSSLLLPITLNLNASFPIASLGYCLDFMQFRDIQARVC